MLGSNRGSGLGIERSAMGATRMGVESGRAMTMETVLVKSTATVAKALGRRLGRS